MSSAYQKLEFPSLRRERPFVCINMVATIDGKIISGKRGEPVADLGSDTDHDTMRSLELEMDAVMLGAGTLRATNGLWYPKELARIVVSGSGKVDFSAKFFADCPEKAFVATGPGVDVPSPIRRLPLDLQQALISLKELGINRLVVEGGSELNASLLKLDLVDELFLTLAPKIKLGRDIPTYADGEPLDRANVQRYTIVEHQVVGDEIFVRYRRNWDES